MEPVIFLTATVFIIGGLIAALWWFGFNTVIKNLEHMEKQLDELGRKEG